MAKKCHELEFKLLLLLASSKSKREEHFENFNHADIYRKIPKISPVAYIFQRPFLRGLFLERLVFRGAYIRTENCVSKSA